MCQISVKFVEANNSYSGLCQVIPKHLFQVFVDYVRHKRPKTEVFRGDLTKVAVTIVCFDSFT